MVTASSQLIDAGELIALDKGVAPLVMPHVGRAVVAAHLLDGKRVVDTQ